MLPTETPDTFVFAPFMLEQIDKIKNDSIKLGMFRALCQYGCYGKYDPIKEDPTGVTDAMLIGMFNAIDRAKKNRDKNRENGKKGGGQIGNKNAAKNKTAQNDPKTSENERKTSNNVLMLCNNDLMNEKERKNNLSSLTATLSSPSEDAKTTYTALKRERKNISVADFHKLWQQLPFEVQLSRQSKREDSANNRNKRIKQWLQSFTEGKDYETALSQIKELMKHYVERWKENKSPYKSHIGYFIEISENIINHINQPQ